MPFASDSELREAAETSLFLVPEVEGKIKHLHVPGVLGRATNVPHPIANLVGATHLEDEVADAVLDRICSEFESRGKAFGWLVGPSSTPVDLSTRLAARGFVKATTLDCMRIVPSLDAHLAENVEVREVRKDRFDEAAHVLAEGYPAPLEAARLFSTDLAGAEGIAARAFLAYVAGEAKPVGVGMMITVPGRRISVFVNSSTREEYRRRGVYRALCAHRLRAAALAGAEWVLVQADQATSAPICRRLGFEPISSLDLHVWMPARLAAAEPSASA